jgi:hypothetical protein
MKCKVCDDTRVCEYRHGRPVPCPECLPLSDKTRIYRLYDWDGNPLEEFESYGSLPAAKAAAKKFTSGDWNLWLGAVVIWEERPYKIVRKEK